MSMNHFFNLLYNRLGELGLMSASRVLMREPLDDFDYGMDVQLVVNTEVGSIGFKCHVHPYDEMHDMVVDRLVQEVKARLEQIDLPPEVMLPKAEKLLERLCLIS